MRARFQTAAVALSLSLQLAAASVRFQTISYVA